MFRMSNVDLDELDDLYENCPVVEPIRHSTKPVNSSHDFQRRTENARNRYRELRVFENTNSLFSFSEDK